ncbi:MAG: response regulator [Verrucomicrobia bacterium]|nr:response regulator [Verrucomicrobiota bacterium]
MTKNPDGLAPSLRMVSERTRVLIVEDELDALELIQFNLHSSGFQTLVARDGWTAVRAAESERPDLILLDVLLPELDGIAVCEILRSKASTSAIPILMLTACATDDCRVLALESGADDFMTKPYSRRELLNRIGQLLPPASLVSQT